MFRDSEQKVEQHRALGEKLSKAKALATDEPKRLKLLQLAQSWNQMQENLKIDQKWLSANPKQKLFTEAFWSGKFNTLAFLAANRTGKSFCVFWFCCAKWILEQGRSGDIVWVVSPSWEKSVSGPQKELWEALPRQVFAEQTYDSKIGFGVRKVLQVQLPSGQLTVRFKSYDQPAQAFEQEKVSAIFCDESFEESLYDRMLARLLDTGGPMVIATIPDEPWMFSRIVNAGPDEKIFSLTAGMADNAMNLAPGAVERALAEMTPEEAEMRVYGKFRFVSGLVYKEFDKEKHVVKPFDVPTDWPRIRCLDYGNSHYTVCLWLALAPNGCVYVYREYYAKMKSVSSHASEIKRLSGDEDYIEPRLIIDPSCFNTNQSGQTSPTSIAKLFQAEGIPCKRGIQTNQYGEMALVQKIRQRIAANKLKVFNSCQLLISEFAKWSYKQSKNHEPLASDSFEDRNNDALDTLKYGLFDSALSISKQSYQVIDNATI